MTARLTTEELQQIKRQLNSDSDIPDIDDICRKLISEIEKLKSVVEAAREACRWQIELNLEGGLVGKEKTSIAKFDILRKLRVALEQLDK